MRDLAAYVQYLMVSPTKYDQSYFGEHHIEISHDRLNRQMREEVVRPREVWLSVKDDVICSENGYVVFDDSTLDKKHSRKIELCGKHWSGNCGTVITGISMVTCVYINPELDRWWVIDYRIYDFATDGKSKLQHMEEMLVHTTHQKALPFKGVLMDTWYAKNEMMTLIAGLGKYFYCPIQKNRKVSRGTHWTTSQQLEWDEENTIQGQTIHLKGLSKSEPIRLHRRTLLTKTSDASPAFLITNDVTLNDSKAVETINSHRWKIEQLHRELKQLTGIEKCQCRKARAQRNHIACAMLAWVNLKRAAYKLGQTIYQLKQKLLDEYIKSKINQTLIFA